MLFKNIQVEDLVLIFLWISQILIYLIHFGLGYSFNVDILFIFGGLKFIYKLVTFFPGVVKESMNDNNLALIWVTIAWYLLFYVLSALSLAQVLFGKNGIIPLI